MWNNWPDIKRVVNVLIMLQRNSKHISHNLSSPLGTETTRISALRCKRYYPGVDHVCNAG